MPEDNLAPNSPGSKEALTKGNSLFVRILHLAINVFVAIIVFGVAYLYWENYTQGNLRSSQILLSYLNRQVEATPANNEREIVENEPASFELAPIAFDLSTQQSGILRTANIHTRIPARPRVNVITYTVQSGDSLFSIAGNFGLKPETILWGNFETLEDNPHLLTKGQVLNILPVDGAYYQWKENDDLQQIAAFFRVDVEAITNYPGNQLDLTALISNEQAVTPGDWLIVPGGKRPLKDWGPPAISRSNPASARFYGPGHCGAIYEGAIGSGTFIWPTVARYLSGYDYSAIHPAIDIAGDTGNAIFATDSGVVVYSGWSNYGYGYLIVIDHGNGWQSAYSHLSAVAVTCGQSVYQGGYIGAMGSTGNSSGPHLHFELVYNGAKVNPWNFLR